MRITNKMMYDTAIETLSSQLERLTRQRDQTTSGKAFENLSDSPIAASQTLSLKSTLQDSQSHLDTAHAADDWMSASELAFNNLTDLAKRGMELGTAALSETNSAAERLGMSTEIQGILDEVLNTANSKHNNSYIFSGYAVNQVPFDIQSGSVVYSGDDGTIQQDLGGHTIAINANGRAIFEPMMQALIDLNQGMRDNDTAAIDTAVGKLMSAAETASQMRTLNGTRQRQVRMSISNLEQTQLELKKLINGKEDINMVEAVTRLKQEETSYQTVLEVEQRTISAMNLFEAMR